MALKKLIAKARKVKAPTVVRDAKIVISIQNMSDGDLKVNVEQFNCNSSDNLVAIKYLTIVTDNEIKQNQHTIF